MIEAAENDEMEGEDDIEWSVLFRRCTNAHTQLLLWYGEVSQKYDGELFWTVPTKARNPADPATGPLFPLVLDFVNANVAQMLVLYWSAHVVLDQTSYLTENKLKHNARKDTNDECWPRSQYIASIAKMLCQSIEYCYQRKNGTVGVQSTVFPRWAAREFFGLHPKYQQELAWTEQCGDMECPDSLFHVKVLGFRGRGLPQDGEDTEESARREMIRLDEGRMEKLTASSVNLD